MTSKRSGKPIQKTGKKKRQSLGILRIPMAVFTVGMGILFVLGVVSFFTVPPRAQQEAREIEEMLRKQQEEEERRRREKEAELARRAEEERQREEEYQQRLEEEKENNPLLGNYSDSSELNVTGVGDSVMLSAVNALYATFPHGYFDAVFGRTLYDAKSVVTWYETNHSLGDAVVFCLGANSYIEESDIEEINSHCGDRPTFWITTYGVSNDSTEKMIRTAERNERMFIVDWGTLATEHEKEYILPDGLHPNEEGSKAFAELIRETINESVLTSHVKKEDGP